MARWWRVNELRQRVDDYLGLRRGLGFKLRGHDRLLSDFVDYIIDAKTPAVTAQMALAWATKPTNVQPVRWKQRLSAVRGFACYLHALDPSVEVPATDLLAHRHHRPTPYLYSDTEIVDLLAAAGTLHPPLRAATYQTLFGLLAVTGMRVGEAIRLDRVDVDLEVGLIEIRETKFNKSRRIPLHPSAVTAIEDYGWQRDQLSRHPNTPSYFVSTRGTRLLDMCVHAVFRQLVERVGLGPRAGSSRPRIHGLRHTFAVTTLRDWYRAGADVAAKMPLLSAYLGHANPVSTYWYLQAAPDLLALAAERLEHPVGEAQ